MLAVAVCLKQDRYGNVFVLLVKQAPDRWQFPTGPLFEDEMPYEAASRALMTAGYQGHVRRSPIGHYETNSVEGWAFVAVWDAQRLARPPALDRPAWFHLAAAVRLLQENRQSAFAKAMLAALKEAVRWFCLQ